MSRVLSVAYATHESKSSSCMAKAPKSDPVSDTAGKAGETIVGFENRFAPRYLYLQLRQKNFWRNMNSTGNISRPAARRCQFPKIRTIARTTIRIVHSVCGARRGIEKPRPRSTYFSARHRPQRTAPRYPNWIAAVRPHRIVRGIEMLIALVFLYNKYWRVTWAKRLKARLIPGYSSPK